MQQNKKLTYLSDFGLLFAAFVWGITFVMVRDSLVSINPVVLIGYRFMLAAIILGLILAVKRIELWRNWQAGFTLGCLLWLLYIPQTIGLQYTTITNSGFITALFVAFVPVLSWIFFRQIPVALRWIATAVSLAGLYLLTGGLKTINIGDLLTLLAALANAGHIVAGDHLSKLSENPYALSFQQFLTVGLLSLLTAVIFHLPFRAPAPIVGVIVFLALVPSLLAFTIQLVAQKHTSAVKVALIFALEPVFAALTAWTVGGERVTIAGVLGGLLIVVAMILGELPVEITVRRIERSAI